MRDPVIHKFVGHLPIVPNLVDRAAASAAFSWQPLRDELAPGAGDALNIGRLAVDRHASGPRAQHTALRLISADGSVQDLSYAELKRLTASAWLLGHIPQEAWLLRLWERVEAGLPQAKAPADARPNSLGLQGSWRAGLMRQAPGVLRLARWRWAKPARAGLILALVLSLQRPVPMRCWQHRCCRSICSIR